MTSTTKGLSTLAIIIIGAVVIAGVILLALPGEESGDTATSSRTNAVTEEVEQDDDEDHPVDADEDSADDDDTNAVGTDAARTVTYTSSGFSPQTLTVSVGTTVRFENDGGGAMWVASDVHPSHTEYDGTSRSEHCTEDGISNSFDQCDSGDVYTFTFDKVGEFDYHNHRNAQHGGTIVVQ